MSQELVRGAPPLPTEGEMQTLWRLSEGMARSRSLGKVDRQDMTADHIFTKLVLGRELGLSVGQSLMGFYLFDGNAQMHYSTLLSAVQARGWDYEIEWLNEEGFKGAESEDTAGCSVTWISPEGARKGPSRFTVADAKAAQLWTKQGKGGGPGVWKTATRNMCLARCVSNGVKAYIPAATGGIPVYTDADDLDRIERVPNLAEGNGDGSEPGWGTMPISLVGEVEKVIRRAEKLGHGALANRASVQQIVKGMDGADLAAWLRDATASLEALKASREQREPAVEGTAEEVAATAAHMDTESLKERAAEDARAIDGIDVPQAPPAEPTFPEATGESDVPSTWPGAPPSVTDPANAKVVEPAREYGEQAPAPASGLSTPPAQPPAPQAPDAPEAPPQAPEARPKRKRATPAPQQHTITVPATTTQTTATAPTTATQTTVTASEAPAAPADDPEEELDLFGDGDDA